MRRVIAVVCVVILATLISLVVLRHNNTSLASESSEPNTTEVADKDAGLGDDVTVDGPTEQPESKADSKPANGDVFAYTATPGDSYTALARDAIAKLSADKKISLSADQTLAAEVALVNEAGAPELEIDQKVTLDKAAVERVVQQVQPIQAAEPDKTAESPKDDETNKSTKDSSELQATAEAGDSYTTLARELIGKYMTSQKISLSNDQRVAAETFLTTSAGSMELEIGQQITVSQDAMKAAVDQAQKLTAEQQAEWSVYAAMVVF